LADKWPAARTRKVAAGVKISLLISAIADGPKRIALYGERTSEVKTLRIGQWVKDRILLIDLGFYKHNTFARIDENGGFFISRLKNIYYVWNDKILEPQTMIRHSPLLQVSADIFLFESLRSVLFSLGGISHSIQKNWKFREFALQRLL